MLQRYVQVSGAPWRQGGGWGAPEQVLNEGGGCDCCKEVELFYEGECAAGSHVGRPTGLGEASLVLFRARRNTLGSTLESSLDCPGGAGRERRGRRASPSSTAPESGAFTPSSLPYCFRHLVKDPPRYPHSIDSSTVQGRRPGAPLTFPQEKGFKRNV